MNVNKSSVFHTSGCFVCVKRVLHILTGVLSIFEEETKIKQMHEVEFPDLSKKRCEIKRFT